MPSLTLDGIDRKLASLLQTAFPFTVEPFADLGLQLGIRGEEVISRIEGLKEAGIVRQIGPVLDARSLGYRTTLVAMRLAEDRLDEAARIIAEHPGVSHAYERNHHFNFWFTLAIPPVTDFDAELKQLAADINPEAIFSLPAVKMFKLRAYFAMDEGSQAAVDSGIQSGEFVPQPFGLSESDRMIVNGLQQDLPLVPRPFDALAEQAGMILDDFLVHCRMLQQSGVIRRFGAAINHKRAGFKANAMTCWMAPPEIVDAAGEKLAALREVSHCYERQTNPLWHHNLFAMIHHDSAEGCRQIADRVAAETGLGDCIMLFSTREFKKVRVRYQV